MYASGLIDESSQGSFVKSIHKLLFCCSRVRKMRRRDIGDLQRRDIGLSLQHAQLAYGVVVQICECLLDCFFEYDYNRNRFDGFVAILPLFVVCFLLSLLLVLCIVSFVYLYSCHILKYFPTFYSTFVVSSR